MTRFLDWIETGLKVLMTVLFGLLVIPVTMQVVSRLDWVPRYIWTEEIARFCFVWIIMLGAMIAVRDEGHFDVDLLPAPRTPFGKGLSRLVVHVAIGVMALCFIWYGWKFAQRGMLQTSEIAGLPLVYIFGAWPLAGVIWCLFIIEKFVGDIRLMRGLE